MPPRSPAELERLQARYDAAFQGISPPFAFVDLEAMRGNAAALSGQAAPLPIRIASKSVRSTAVLKRILDLDERFRGVLSFTLPEALHLAREGHEDIFVGYPTADRKALGALAAMVERSES
jgi:D-serine deaminase-like pyridoxal phosphate-dependent protein